MRRIAVFFVAAVLLAACSDDTNSGNDVAGGDTGQVGQDTAADNDAGDTTVPSDTNVTQDTFVPGDTTTDTGTGQDTSTQQDTTVGDTGTDVGPGTSPVGGACSSAADCAGANAECIAAADGFPGGYCVIGGCSAGTCPSGSTCWRLVDESTVCLPDCDVLTDCRDGYLCDVDNVCWPGQACDATSCPSGQTCGDKGLCEQARCTPGSCETGFVCSNGVCIIDIGTVPTGTPPTSCPNVPDPTCTGTAAYCGELVPFDPTIGTGYWNYPLNGETSTNQYRSFIRRDMMMMIKYAAAKVDCVAAGWAGTGGLIGLGDMSEADGSIPGTSVGSPGHPQGTHTDGHDMDIAYYLNTGYPNDFYSGNPNCPSGQSCQVLQPICEHTSGGSDAYHCVGEPYLLDVWRTALFIAHLHDVVVNQSGTYYFQLRVIGADGKAGPLLDAAINALCAADWYDGYACDPSYRALTYETTDEGRGWFLFHHHHFHVSINGLTASPIVDKNRCLLPRCASVDPFTDPRRFLYATTGKTSIELRRLELVTP